MSHNGGVERTLSLVVSVPPQLEGDSVGRVVEQTAHLNVGSYLLRQGGRPSAQLGALRELREDGLATRVAYDARGQRINDFTAYVLRSSGINTAIVSGPPSPSHRALQRRGVGLIGEPFINNAAAYPSKNAILVGVANVMDEQADARRQRILVPKAISAADVASCVEYIVNKSEVPERNLSMYVANGEDTTWLEYMHIASPRTLRLTGQIVVSSTVPVPEAIIDAASEAQAYLLDVA